MTHGGKRANAGRPSADIDLNRVVELLRQGLFHRDIARRLGVSQPTISTLIRKKL